MKNNLRQFSILIGIFTLIFSWQSAHTNSTGAPAGKTGSPGDNSATCGSCHATNAITNESISFETDFEGCESAFYCINFNPCAENEAGYLPGHNYSITVNLQNANTKSGFEACFEDNLGNKVGTILLSDNQNTELVGGSDYITHSNSNNNSWTFDWTAPSEPVGDITLYVACISANGNNNNSGDVLLTETYHLDALTPIGLITEANTISSPTGDVYIGHINVLNSHNESMNIVASRNELSENTPVNYFCWGDYCYLPSVYVSPNTLTIASCENNESFNGYMVIPDGLEGSWDIEYCFFDENYPDSQVCDTITYQSGGDAVITEQTLSMPEGWSMISTYMQAENMNLTNLISSIENQVIIMKNYAGDAFLVEWGFNGIGDMQIEQGYQIKTLASTNLVVSGEYMLPEEHPITLNAGWNMIGYLRLETAPVDLALEDLTENENLIIVKDYMGNVYLPSWGFNGIGDLEPGRGYQLKTNTEDVLIYLSNDQDY